jgi:hypothetical protein
MIKKNRFIEWSIFALIATVYCLLLALRPVPKITSPSDTGRYVQALHQFCAGSEITQAENSELSYRLYLIVTSPACLARSDSLFMFEAAAFLPLIFLLFAKWRNGVILWACSLMFSVIGLEMMTNALRQNLGTLLFFGAIALLQRHRNLAWLFAALAAAIHSSVLFYSPLLILLAGVRLSKKTVFNYGLVLILLGIVFYQQISAFIDQLLISNAFYSEVYKDSLSSFFIFYMIVPIYWIYGVRYFFEKSFISKDEKSCILFTSALLIICFIAFPSILYRFAILGAALQIFITARSEKPGLIAGGFAMAGMLIHLSVMFATSSYYQVLIYG